MAQVESFRHFSHRTIDDSFFCCRREKLFAASELQLIIRKNMWTKFRIISALHQSAAYFWWLIRQNHSNDSAINSIELIGFEWTSNYHSTAFVSNYFIELIVTLGQTVWCSYRYFIFKKFGKSAYYPRIIGESMVFGHCDNRSFVPRCSSKT